MSGTPRVELQEKDLSQSTPALGTNTAATVIEANKGEVNQRTFVANFTDFITKFGDVRVPSFAEMRDVDELILSQKNIGIVATKLLFNEVPNLYMVRAVSRGTLAYAVEGLDVKTATFPIAGQEKLTIIDYQNNTMPEVKAMGSAEALTDEWVDGYTFENTNGSPGIRELEEIAPTASNGFIIGSRGPGKNGNNIAISVQRAPKPIDGKYNYLIADPLVENVEDFPISSETLKFTNRGYRGNEDYTHRVPFVSSTNGFDWLNKYDATPIIRKIGKYRIEGDTEDANVSVGNPLIGVISVGNVKAYNERLENEKVRFVMSLVTAWNAIPGNSPIQMLSEPANSTVKTARWTGITGAAATNDANDNSDASKYGTGITGFIAKNENKLMEFARIQFFNNGLESADGDIVSAPITFSSVVVDPVNENNSIITLDASPDNFLFEFIKGDITDDAPPAELSGSWYKVNNETAMLEPCDEIPTGNGSDAIRLVYVIKQKAAENLTPSSFVNIEQNSHLGRYLSSVAANINSSTNQDWVYAKIDYTVDDETSIWQKLFKVCVYTIPANTNPQELFRVRPRETIEIKSEDGTSVLGSYPSQAYWNRFTPAETFMCSFGDVKDTNNVNYNMFFQVNGQSDFIYIPRGANMGFDLDDLPDMMTSIIPLRGGADSTITEKVSYRDKLAAWKLLSSQNKCMYSLAITPDIFSATENFDEIKAYVNGVAEICIKRQDAILNVTPTAIQNNNPDKAFSFGQRFGGYSAESYVVHTAGFDRFFDSTLGRVIWVPKSVAAILAQARVSNRGNVWDAPAGVPNGAITYSSGTMPVLDEDTYARFYDNNLNSSLLFNNGQFLWGQKTAQMMKSALDRVNVRRMLIYVEQTMKEMLKPYLFNITNDDTSRFRVQKDLEGFLSLVQASGGMETFQVIIDPSINNPPIVVENNQLNVAVTIVPRYIMEYIQLKTVLLSLSISQSGVDITESLM